MHLREWISIFLILGLMGMVIGISHFSQICTDESVFDFSKSSASQSVSKFIQIELTGEVKNPGFYSIEPGISLRQFLSQVGIKKNADRKKINFKKILYSSQKIEIPSKTFSGHEPILNKKVF